MNTLYDLIYKYKNKEFIWGEHDCCLFFCNIIKEITNVDLAEEFREKYASPTEALKLIKILGYKDLVDLADKKLKYRKSAEEARVGDLVFYKDDNIFGGAMGICYGVRAYFLKEGGICALPLRECTYSWPTDKVGIM